MNMAVSESQRKVVLQLAVKKFNHRDKRQHNTELEMGAAHALYQKLVLALSMYERKAYTKILDEMKLICSALEMVYRCSSASRETSFRKIGIELVQLLLRVIQTTEASKYVNSHDIISDVLSVFQYFSRVQSISIPLMNIKGVLNALALVVSSNHMPNSTRATAMSTLADLACAESNGARMARVPGLFDSVMEVAHLDASVETREAAARAIQNILFSMQQMNAMNDIEKVIHALTRLLKDTNDKTRKYASGAMQNITTWGNCQTPLVEYKNGIVLDTLIAVIANNNKYSDSSETRIRCLGALVNLTSNATASTLCTHPNLLNTLTTVAIRSSSAAVQKHAADALCWLAEDMKYSRPGRDELLSCIVNVAQEGNSNGVARAIYEFTSVPSNRDWVAKHPGLLDLLEHMAKKSNKDSDSIAKDCSVQALSNLARR